MEEEIKEILDNPKILMLSYGNYISLDDYVKLKDYITNLQEENEFLKLNNPEMNMEHFRIIKENKRKIDNLREENERLKNRNDFLEKVCVGFDDKYEYIKSINKKAIEYINQYKECEEYSELPCYETYYKDLDIILNGGENND